MYKLTKRFTSRDGKLEVDNREYGLSQEGLDEIDGSKQHLGGATHVFVRIDGGNSNKARLFPKDNAWGIVREEKPESGWVVFDMNKDYTYKPSQGEQGYFNVEVDGAPSEVATGIGLPDSWHVSTFLVFEWQESGIGEPEIPDTGAPEVPETPGNKKIKMQISVDTSAWSLDISLYEDGTYEMSN